MLNEEHHHYHAIDSISKHNLFNPLGLSSMGYTPNCCFELDRIAPTEKDQVFRKCTVHGSVHDPGAHMLGGVCGHAGLFSDTHDLARLGTMMLNGEPTVATDTANQKLLRNGLQELTRILK